MERDLLWHDAERYDVDLFGRASLPGEDIFSVGTLAEDSGGIFEQFVVSL